MQERRREQRTSIDGVFEVVDEYLGETLGKLVDISPKGLRIRSGEPLDVNDELRLRILLPMRILGKSAISATAVCVWSNPDGESDGWLSGFEFYRVSQEACTLILGLILELQKPAETRSV